MSAKSLRKYLNLVKTKAKYYFKYVKNAYLRYLFTIQKAYCIIQSNYKINNNNGNNNS